MTQTSDGYSHARHTARVQAAARAAGIKGAAFAVLAYLCSVSDFKMPTARASREQIERRTGYCEKTVKTALSALRGAGFIVPVAYANGGRGRCPVYTLTTKGGENYPPLAGSSDEKGGKKFPEKGGKNYPPIWCPSICLFQRGERGRLQRRARLGQTRRRGKPRPVCQPRTSGGTQAVE